MSEVPSLLLSIDRYLRATGTTETRFGRLAVNDPRLIGDLRRGRVPGAHVRQRIASIIGDQA